MKVITYKRFFIVFLLTVLYNQLSIYGQDVNPSITYAAAEYKEQALGVFEKLKESNHFVNYITKNDIIELPVGLSKTYGNTGVTIAVSQVKFKPNEAVMTVFVRLQMPQRQEPLYFAVEGVRMSLEGGLIGQGRAALISNERIPLKMLGVDLILKGGIDTNTGGIDNTFIGFDCGGIRELGIVADVEFPRKWLVPVDQEDKRISNPDIKVTGSFKTLLNLEGIRDRIGGNKNADLFDFIAEINLPKFELTKLPDFTFSIQTAVIDLSDINNSSNVVYPEGYINKYLVDNPNLWQGVFIANASIKFPKVFESRSSNQRPLIGADNMLIDRYGFTGEAYAKNILAFGDINAKWPLSLDSIKIKLEAGKFLAGSMQGRLKIPTSEQDTLAYSAVLLPKTQGMDFAFNIKVVDTLQFDVFKANVELFPDSRFELNIADGKWKPEALLNGRMWIGEKKMVSKGGAELKDGEEMPMEFKGIEFKQLHLFTDAPFISVEYFGYNDKLQWAGFPVYIENIALQIQNSNTSLNFTMGLSFEKFSAEAHLKIVGALVNEPSPAIQKLTGYSGNFLHYRFKYVSLDSIGFHVDLGPTEIGGSLMYKKNDPIYGKVFGGSFDINLKSFGSGGMYFQGKGMYGNKENGPNNRFTYGFIDLKANFGLTGIPLFGPLVCNGGAGYFYTKMRKTNSSGMGYMPEPEGGFGFKIAALFSMASNNSTLNGEVGIHGAFGNKTGINYLGIYGLAHIMDQSFDASDAGNRMEDKSKKIDEKEAATAQGNPALAKNLEKTKAENPKKAAPLVFPTDEPMGGPGITAYLGVLFDFTNITFHANLDMYVNVVEGRLVGANAGNKAGSAVLHVDIPKRQWYYYIGTPDHPIALSAKLSPFTSRKAGFYLMTGNVLPDAPPPPEVVEVVGESALDFTRDLQGLKSGVGFAFGGFLGLEKNYDIAVASLDMKGGMGFDVMLKDYKNARCEGSTEPIGIGGFYATGQTWSYITADVKVRFGPARATFAKVGIATLLQARLPRPTFIRGTLAIVLKTKVCTKRIRATLELGDNCKIAGMNDSPVGEPIIADYMPKEGTQATVFAAPQVTIREGEANAIEGEDDQGRKMFFRVKLREYTLEANGQKIEGDISWDADRTAVTLTSLDILPPKTSIKAYIKFGFEKSADKNNWQKFYVNGKEYTEDKSFTFTTGEAPDNIPLQNVAYTYPVVGQRNFFKGEYNQGYIKLKRGQPYLFTSENKYEMVVIKGDQIQSRINYTYDPGARQINYTIPEQLDLSNNYTFDWLSIASMQGTPTENTTVNKVSTENVEMETEAKKAQNMVREDGARSLISYNFRTSKYLTLQEKMNALNTSSFYGRISSDVINLQLRANNYEPFDISELAGSAYSGTKPLIETEAILDDNYFTERIYPKLYTSNPLTDGVHITNRDTTVLGFKPVRALYITNTYLTEIQNNKWVGIANTQIPFVYNLPQTYKLDFIDLQNQVVNRFLGNPRQYEFEQLILGTYPFISQGDYKVKYQYILPDGTTTGSSAIIKYHNSIR